MRTFYFTLCLAIGLFLCPFAFSLQAQLGFCGGNSGDPIVNETFGTGTDTGPALPVGTTSYTFVSSSPADGSYTIASSIPYFDWHNIQDHTPNESNGKCLVVNADYTPGEFYNRNVTGLCENTSYEFSSWLINLLPSLGCGGAGIPINVQFQIWDASDTDLLASGETGNIPGTSSPNWEQYGLVFSTLPGQTSVILKMINNGVGGCGNDLALDDIVFKTCGDFIGIADLQDNAAMVLCDIDAPVAPQLTATPDFSIYSSHAYQWQESADGTTWSDIPGATGQQYNASPIFTTTYYRTKVAEDPINLSSPLCSSVSEIYTVTVVPRPDPPLSSGNLALCTNETPILRVSVPNNVQVNWYDAPSGGNLLASATTSYSPSGAGTYYAEAVPQSADCTSASRTAVTLDLYELPAVTDEFLEFCEDGDIILSAGIQNVSYDWSTGESTPRIRISSPGTYTVMVTNMYGCSALKTISLEQIDLPVVEGIRSVDYDLFIDVANKGDFEYSLDGQLFQDEAVFRSVEGGLLTIWAREKKGCGAVILQYIHLVVPKFFTPNGDNINDSLVINGLENYPNFEINIFDRYGKLLKSSSSVAFAWDGTFRGRMLPADDYWYLLQIGSSSIKGHFALKR